MVDVYFVDDCYVEFFEDEVLCDVLGEVGMVDYVGYWLWFLVFVGGLVVFVVVDCECWDDFYVEGVGVIVVD